MSRIRNRAYCTVLQSDKKKLGIRNCAECMYFNLIKKVMHGTATVPNGLQYDKKVMHLSICNRG